jgi:hypothetical protein
MPAARQQSPQFSKENPMETEHVSALRRFRGLTVEHRRKIVVDMTTPKERGGAQDLREMFLKLQITIEAIDRALGDELALSASSPSQPG